MILDWIRPGFKRGIVHIGHAISKDGIEWVKSEQPVLSPRLDAVKSYEAVVSKPGIILMNGTYHMWLSVFTMRDEPGYRLNYARSKDGLHWERFADEEIMPLTPDGFDSKNQSYANVIEQGDEVWMFYVGNELAQPGLDWQLSRSQICDDSKFLCGSLEQWLPVSGLYLSGSGIDTVGKRRRIAGAAWRPAL